MDRRSQASWQIVVVFEYNDNEYEVLTICHYTLLSGHMSIDRTVKQVITQFHRQNLRRMESP